MSTQGWIGVDFDGTLAHYDEWRGPTHCGGPIPLMVERVKVWLAAGRDVRIFTARVFHDGTDERIAIAQDARAAITRWCLTHLGAELPITNVKDYAMVSLFDDRAVQVETNTGKLIA